MKLKLLMAARVDVIQADFSKLSEVRKTADVLLENYPRIDVLINNIGCALHAPHIDRGWD